MENEFLSENFKLKSHSNSSEILKENMFEKGSMENFLFCEYNNKCIEYSPKELMYLMDDKEKFGEKEELCENNLVKEKENIIEKSHNSNQKNFNFETLNRDLADIEERLRATRLSWNKNGKSSAHEANENDLVRKSWSLVDIDKRAFSNGNNINNFEGGKRHSGEKLFVESPAMSEGLLKWDYGADIGLTQDDSDDMEPITWPVTAEQAQREAQISELGVMNRRMKISLSQGSFLSSPDPEDRQNLIAKISEEYKSNKLSDSAKVNHTNASTEIISMTNGVYDDQSARQIMEQAEAAEKRLRQRLEAVKAYQLTDSAWSRKNDDRSVMDYQKEISSFTVQPGSDSNLPREMCTEKNITGNNIEFETIIKMQQSTLIEDFVPDAHKPISGDENCKSPTSITNTGRTTTMESTHTMSDYGRAPVFNGDVYGTRKDAFSNENRFVLYSKQNRESINDPARIGESRDGKALRTICGMTPELDTISSRETLQNTDDKKDEFSPPINAKSSIDRVDNLKDLKNIEGSVENLSDKDISQEHSLQAKWNQFKSMMKGGGEFNSITFEKPIVKPIILNAAKPVNDQSYHHRQHSNTTTFTTITNMSPRCDSFATDAFKNSPRENHNWKNSAIINRKTDAEENSKHKSTNEKIIVEKVTRQNNQRHGSSQCLNSRSGSGKRLIGGGGGKDNEDDDEISQTEKRKIRHAGELRRLKKRFGSGQLDGETTASELEHDDMSKFKRNLIEKERRKKQLSQLLTDLSIKGVVENNVHDLTDSSESSSVDTMLLMNKMSQLLLKKKSEVFPKKGRENFSENLTDIHHRGIEQPQTRQNSNKIIESDNAKLILKHLMLKQKVKWLADCAREEGRRRKIRKLEKLLDSYEQGKPIIITDDLQTETATLMGSERGSQDSERSQLNSYSTYDENTNVDNLLPENGCIEYCDDNKMQENSWKNSYRNQYHNCDQKYPETRKEKCKKNEIKNYPRGQSWNIPLKDFSSPYEGGDANESNVYHYDSPMVQYMNNQKCYSSTRDGFDKSQSKHTYLTTRERIQLRRELELARQRNAHECQKDIRQSRIGNTKVTNGGLAWSINAYEMGDNHMSEFQTVPEERRKSYLYNDENRKDKMNNKSELQLAFERHMERFISHSRQRQKRIKLAIDERRYESQMNQERSRLFFNQNDRCRGTKRRRPTTYPDPLSVNKTATNSSNSRKIKTRSQSGNKSKNAENLYKPRRRRLSKSEMRSQSARKYQSLPEVQARYLNEHRKAKMLNNRMKMHLYGEKILQSVLRNRAPWVSEKN